MNRHLLALIVALLIAACSSMPRPNLPSLRMPDFSTWFENENLIEVAEVGRAVHCGGENRDVRVALLPDLASAKAWTAGRGIVLPGIEEGQLLDAPYAVVELGYRDTGGYGVAVSRQAGLKDDVLVLKATFFEPGQGRWASSEASSPCAIVSLPPRQYRSLQLIDQAGALRASAGH